MIETELIPFGDLALEVAEIKHEINEATNRVLKSGWFILGQELEAFEIEFARYLGAGFAIGCGNGTDAITLALDALDIGIGDEIITVANTCVPTAAGIRATGCQLRLVDCDPQTLQMDAKQLQEAITPKTRAVVPVHLYGSCPEMGKIVEICQKANLPVIEDCAQAHGAEVEKRKAGRWGMMATWSFYPSKNLGAYGDGGAITTDDDELARRLKKLRNYGQSVRYYHDEEGRNSRLDELQAAILRVKLGYLDTWNERRRKLAGIYDESFNKSIVKTPQIVEECIPARHLYVVRVAANKREKIRDQLSECGIATQIHYPVPLHQQKAYVQMFPDSHFPSSEQAASELITLPLYPQMTNEQAQRVTHELLRIIKDC